MDSWILQAYREAEPSRWEALCRGLRSGVQGRPEDATKFVILGVVMLLVVVVIGLVPYLLLARDRPFNGPRRLFLGLCRAHGLTWQERRWLWRLARSQRLREPARLFVEPERFSASRLSPALRKQAAALAQLQERLFRETATPLILPATDKPEVSLRAKTPLPPAAAPPTFELPSLPADPLASR